LIPAASRVERTQGRRPRLLILKVFGE